MLLDNTKFFYHYRIQNRIRHLGRSTHMLKGTDFILNPDKLETEYQLVEINEWIDFNTKEKFGFYYTVLLPKLKFEKIKIGIKAPSPIVTKEELDEKEQVPVIFEDLKTWASLYNGRLSVKAEAKTVKKVDRKQ